MLHLLLTTVTRHSSYDTDLFMRSDEAVKSFIFLNLKHRHLGPGLQSFLKIKVTSFLREVIFGHENQLLISIFRITIEFNLSSTSQAGSCAEIWITYISIRV